MNYNALKDRYIYVALFVVLVLTVLIFPKEAKFKYNYQKGRPWMYETLLSPIDFPILKTQQEILEEMEQKASLVVPCFNYDNSVSLSQINRLKALQGTENVDNHFLYAVIENLNSFYDRGITPDLENISTVETLIIQRDKRAAEVPSTEVFSLKGAAGYLKYNLSSQFPDKNIDSLYASYKLGDYIVPNLIYDEIKTDLIHKEAVDYISPTKGIMYAGQLIVSEGETVTAEIQQLLDSYKAEYEMTYGNVSSTSSLVIAHIIISLAILSVLFVVIFFTNKRAFTTRKQFLFILTLYLLAFALASLIGSDSQTLKYVVPFSVLAIYLSLFFKRSFVFAVYTVMLIPILFIVESGAEIFFMNLCGGIVSIVSFRYFNRGWMQFLNSFIAFVAMLTIHIAMALMTEDSNIYIVVEQSFAIAFNSLLIVACYPIVFLFERIFSLVSQSRLLELSDTNNKLLRELATKAPGTFQHSLQVSNLASDAAAQIGADMMLARVGALYHDIGKMRNPQCFVENRAARVDYHKGLSPMESAKQIIRHVDDGVEIAKKNRLPEIVIDFIRTHHAQSLTFYFYAEYCNNGGDPENIAPFKYNGVLPKTKEQVIVLMADAVEAASRSLKDYSAQSISDLVENIIGKRLSDSQLADADISIREISVVKQMFKSRLEQVYHERIAYPEIKK